MDKGDRVKIKEPKHFDAGTDFYEGTIIETKGKLYQVQSEKGKDAWYLKEELTNMDDK